LSVFISEITGLTASRADSDSTGTANHRYSTEHNIVVEVEAGNSLDGGALDQLEDFSKPGYTRALVVPDSVVDDGVQFIEEYTDAATANIVVCGPSDMPELL
jgi:hypothetical protein